MKQNQKGADFKIEIQELIGNGSFASVYLAIDKSNGLHKQVAVKIVNQAA